MLDVVDYLGFKVLNRDYKAARTDFLAGSVLTISPNSYGITTKNQALKRALKRPGILVLDGVYFGLGYFLRTGRTIHKNQGPHIFYQELEIQKSKHGRVFFLGATESTLRTIEIRMAQDYPEISVGTYSPPFKDRLSDEDNEVIRERIQAFNPAVIFVGMTCPKQEIWVDENIEDYPGKILMAVGGVFDWFAGNYSELHPLWWRLRLAWLGRMIQRPEILKRNMPNILLYVRDMLKG